MTNDKKNQQLGLGILNHEISRRQFLHTLGAGVVGGALFSSSLSRAASSAPAWYVPAESVKHVRCWMSWPEFPIWGPGLLERIEADVALIANTIAQYEPVMMCANGAISAASAKKLCGADVTVIDSIAVNDCWMRDSGPIFRVDREGKKEAVGLNFNGWGKRQVHQKDKLVAEKIAAYLKIPFVKTDIVSEGGAIEHDGDGTLIATESSIINDNRNKGKTKAQIEAAMLSAYGAQKVLWVPGLRNKDITDDHIDATARFVSPGVVLVQLAPPERDDVWAKDAQQMHDILSQSVDAKGRHLKVVTLEGPDSVRSDKPEDFLDSYINFYLANGALITAQFGDEVKDAAAKNTFASLYPNRKIEMLKVDDLHSWGGGIHCITQQEPA